MITAWWCNCHCRSGLQDSSLSPFVDVGTQSYSWLFYNRGDGKTSHSKKAQRTHWDIKQRLRSRSVSASYSTKNWDLMKHNKFHAGLWKYLTCKLIIKPRNLFSHWHKQVFRRDDETRKNFSAGKPLRGQDETPVLPCISLHCQPWPGKVFWCTITPCTSLLCPIPANSCRTFPICLFFQRTGTNLHLPCLFLFPGCMNFHLLALNCSWLHPAHWADPSGPLSCLHLCW